MTVPSGRRSPSETISGYRSVTSSSPRDHKNVCWLRRMSCERIPSHFHSACHWERPRRATRRVDPCVCQKVRIGATDIGIRRVLRHQLIEEARRGFPFAHQAMSDRGGFHS